MEALESLAEARQALADGEPHRALASIEPYLCALEAEPPESASAVLEVYAAVLDPATGAAARAASEATEDVERLSALGDALIAQQELRPAIGVLRRACLLAPDDARVAHALATAEERLGDYTQAIEVLEQAPPSVRALAVTRYRHAVACFMLRDLAPARRVVDALVKDPDEAARVMGAHLRGMLERHAALAEVDGGNELRAWHAIWTGEVAVSVERADATLPGVRRALEGVKRALRTWRVVVPAVSAPDERDSVILGRALADVLGVPFVATPGVGLTAVWDVSALRELDVERLRRVSPGALLFVHQGRGDEELPLAADLVGDLFGTGAAPWRADDVRAIVQAPLDRDELAGFSGFVHRFRGLDGQAMPAGVATSGLRPRRCRHPAEPG